MSEKLQISPSIPLVIQGNHMDHVTEMSLQAQAYITSDNMYHHLNMLENLVFRSVCLFPC